MLLTTLYRSASCTLYRYISVQRRHLLRIVPYSLFLWVSDNLVALCAAPFCMLDNRCIRVLWTTAARTAVLAPVLLGGLIICQCDELVNWIALDFDVQCGVNVSLFPFAVHLGL